MRIRFRVITSLWTSWQVVSKKLPGDVEVLVVSDHGNQA